MSEFKGFHLGKKIKSKTFLENGFPIEELHHLALMEGNSKRPIYQIHKWWARRLGSVFRTLLISSFLPSHESPRNFWTKYYNGFSLKNIVIYDPMMGGGTSIVEGLKLGCKVIGSDINPVAWFVTKKEVERFDEEVVNTYFHNLEEQVGKEIKKFYETSCPKGHKCESVYSLWIRRIECKDCKKQFDLFNSLIIRHYGNNKKDDIITCPKCDGIFQTKQNGKIIKCNLCKSYFNKDYKAAHRGVFTCPSCGSKEKVVDNIKRLGKFLPTRMFCIEYDCKKCGRGFKSPDENDFKLFEKAKKIFLRNKINLLFPKQLIPDQNMYDRRPLTHGFRYFHELFNPRQLLSLSLLLKEIKKIPEDNVREFLLLAFSSSLETNNALCKYETNWGKISALFGMPAYQIPERYGENNIWGKGRGSFPRAYFKLKRGKKFAQNTCELFYSDKIKKTRNQKKFPGESIITHVSDKYSKFLLPGQKAQLVCRDSSKMSIIDSKSVDIVMTDPPYFDTIQYSRLADFFYVWLRLVLKDRYSWFQLETSKRDNEVVAQKGSEISRNGFVSSLTDIFKESNRVLKDDGILVFTFHHAKTWAWSGIRKALQGSGFCITATPIIRSEGRTGFKKGRNTSYDVCVVCRKQERCLNIDNALSLGSYTKTVRLLKKLDSTIGASDIFTVVMSKYLSVDNSTAEKIMENSSSLVAEIQKKTGIKNNF